MNIAWLFVFTSIVVFPSTAIATGSEMAGLLLAWWATVATFMLLATLLIVVALPKSWPHIVRWVIAALPAALITWLVWLRQAHNPG